MKNLIPMRTPYIAFLIFIFALSLAWLKVEYIRSMTVNQQRLLTRFIGTHVSPQMAYKFLTWTNIADDSERLYDLMPVIGESAYKRWGADGFSICTDAQFILCFHGVMLGAIERDGYSKESIRAITAQCQKMVTDNSRNDGCGYAAGYTILRLNTYWYIESLQYCDSFFEDSRDRYLCWRGVSHENAQRTGESLKGLNQVPWPKDNIYYPCDSIPLLYQPACVHEQVIAVRRIVFDRDTKKSVLYCEHFTRIDTTDDCMDGIIEILSREFGSDRVGGRAQCRFLPALYMHACETVFDQ